MAAAAALCVIVYVAMFKFSSTRRVIFCTNFCPCSFLKCHKSQIKSYCSDMARIQILTGFQQFSCV